MLNGWHLSLFFCFQTIVSWFLSLSLGFFPFLLCCIPFCEPRQQSYCSIVEIKKGCRHYDISITLCFRRLSRFHGVDQIETHTFVWINIFGSQEKALVRQREGVHVVCSQPSFDVHIGIRMPESGTWNKGEGKAPSPFILIIEFDVTAGALFSLHSLLLFDDTVVRQHWAREIAWNMSRVWFRAPVTAWALAYLPSTIKRCRFRCKSIASQ